MNVYSLGGNSNAGRMPINSGKDKADLMKALISTPTEYKPKMDYPQIIKIIRAILHEGPINTFLYIEA